MKNRCNSYSARKAACLICPCSKQHIPGSNCISQHRFTHCPGSRCVPVSEFSQAAIMRTVRHAMAIQRRLAGVSL